MKKGRPIRAMVGAISLAVVVMNGIQMLAVPSANAAFPSSCSGTCNFKDKDFGGARLDTGMSCVVWLSFPSGWNDQITSFWNNGLTVDYYYEDINLVGKYFYLDPGFSNSNLAQAGWNDRISSLKQ